MKLDSALFNWLQSKILVEALPDDHSAGETETFFLQILREDHQIEQITYEKKEDMYLLTYVQNGTEHTHRVDAEQAETLLRAVTGDPRESDAGCFFPEDE